MGHTPEPWESEASSHTTRFWSKVNVLGDDDCWEWKEGQSSGYGSFSIGDTKVKSHRFAYRVANTGPMPECVCHACDNPLCCNPDHLWAGTRADNNNDARSKGRARNPQQGCGPDNTNATLGISQVLAIRMMAASGRTYRDIANAVGCSRSNVCLIVRGKRWSHLTDNYVNACVNACTGMADPAGEIARLRAIERAAEAFCKAWEEGNATDEEVWGLVADLGATLSAKEAE